jgi:TetR/AcrR family transcriptional regulator, transcriptional repressor for nem operon
VVRITDKRERLMEAAKELIHRQGLAQTTLADIAGESGVPLGNVYYYFKTKDEIASAVIEEYRQEMNETFRKLDESEPDPKRRLAWFIKSAAREKENIADHGCRVGSLCQELNKDTTPLADKADDIFAAQIKWAAAQFKLIGRKDAADLAVQLVATLQGISLLGNAMKSPALISRQITMLCDWVNQM